MPNSENKTTLTLSRHMTQLVCFLVGTGIVSSAGFGLYVNRTLPNVKEDLVVLQRKFEILEREFNIRATHVPRAHVSWREYDADILLMKEARGKMEEDIKELIDIKALIRALGQKP